MPELPAGTVTFLFTDVEGSTRRWEQDSPAMLTAVERHFALIAESISKHNGVLFKTIGDAVQAAFPLALDGVLAAVESQRALSAEDWGSVGPIRVRMALHTGAATPREGDYLAPALNRLARLLTAGAGGQILLTEATRNLVRSLLPADVQLRDLGEHRLRDLRDAENVYQVVGPDLPDDFPPLKSLDRPQHNLPAQLTTFIGRAREVEAIRDQLLQPTTRVLTLTGPGGTGKTRLALEVASSLTTEYADGVWLVPLAPVSNARLVAPTIAESLNVRETAGETVLESLRAFLQTKRLLLVLDNFEQVVEAAPVIVELLSASPGLQVLVTSRARLRITGEYEIAITPLTLPMEDRGVRLDDALASEAVRLFVDRAQAVRRDFSLNDRNAGTVVNICRRLDGLPLAIELAAARVRLLTPEAILERLDNRLTLLTGGSRDRPERQQTLRAAISWSHDLLDPTEQALFRRLAVFSGGWTLEAAESVVNAVETPYVSVIDCLEVLNDNSLIRIEEEADDELSGPRFVMLQTIRDYGQETLEESGELPAIRDAHAQYFADLATRAGSHLTSRKSVGWLGRLETDHDNLRGALSWLVERGDSERALALAASLWRFWWMRGHIDEGRAELESALSIASDNLRLARAAALDGAGVLAESQGDYARAEELHEAELSVSRQIGDKAAIARALNNLGVVATDRGDLARAESLLRESLELAREANDLHIAATALNDLGNVADEQGQSEQAEALLRESLALRRRLGNESDIARSLNNLGFVVLGRGEPAQARKLYEESLGHFRAAGDKPGEAAALTGLAESQREEGNILGAIALFEQSLAHFRDVGDVRSTAVVLLNLADIARSCDAFTQASAQYREALSRFEAVSDRSGVVDGLAGLGGVLAQEEKFEAAAQLLGAASALSLPDESVTPSHPGLFDADVEAVRTALGEQAFQTAWESGRSLDLADAVALASAVETV
jgi:predicted ATPase/class 3 adenylate cyclase/Tfp pilus assembly protein PilF